jgi:hypothetical protein
LTGETVHLTFGGAAFGSLSVALSALKEHRVVGLRECLSIGPLFDLDKPTGIEARRDWMKRLYKGTHAGQLFRESADDVGLPIIDQLGAEFSDFVVWCGPNADEQILLRAVAARLPGKVIRIVDVSKLPSETFHPRAVGECSTDILYRAFATAHALLPFERDALAADWRALLCQHGTLRFYIDGVIVHVPESYFDEALLAATPVEFGRAVRVAALVMGESPHLIGDAFIDYRLRQLLAAGTIEAVDPDQDLRSLQIRQRVTD